MKDIFSLLKTSKGVGLKNFYLSVCIFYIYSVLDSTFRAIQPQEEKELHTVGF